LRARARCRQCKSACKRNQYRRCPDPHHHRPP
jgi:hypothetical protein